MSHVVLPRNTLADFLRARREELGLSQETLVSKTGYRLTVCHYSRIECGRRMPSACNLDIIADALDLHWTVRELLHNFIPERAQAKSLPPQERIPEAALRVAKLHKSAAAYIIDQRMMILSWNPVACEIFGIELDSIKDEQDRNLALLVFSSPTLRSRLRNWETYAHRTVAFCRNRWAKHGKDGKIQQLFKRMSRFPDFATWWDQPEATLLHNVRMEVDHPAVGLIVLEHSPYRINANPNLDLVLAMPLPESDSEEKVRDIMMRRQQRRKD